MEPRNPGGRRRRWSRLLIRLGRRAAAARECAGLTQTELARRLGTRQQNISRLEWGGQNATIELLESLARELGRELRVSFEAAPTKPK